MAGPLMPYTPTPLGDIAGLTAAPSISAGPIGAAVGQPEQFGPPAPPAAEPVDQMAAEGLDHVGAMGAKTPSVPFTEIKTKIDPETGDQTHTVSGMTDAFLQEITNLTRIGRQAQGAYDEAIAKVRQKQATLEAHPILAEVGRLASLASIAYQPQGLRGATVAPLVRAAGAYGYGTFGESPEQLSLKAAGLEAQKVALEMPISNLTERALSHAEAAQDRKDRLNESAATAAANLAERKQANLDDIVTQHLKTSQGGFGTDNADQEFKKEYLVRAAPKSQAEYDAAVQRADAVVAQARETRASVIAEKDRELRNRFRIAAEGRAPQTPNQFSMAALSLGYTHAFDSQGAFHVDKLTPAQADDVKTYVDTGFSPADIHQMASSIIHPHGGETVNTIRQLGGIGGPKIRGKLIVDAQKQAAAEGIRWSTGQMDVMEKLYNSFNSDAPRTTGALMQSYDAYLQHSAQAIDAQAQLVAQFGTRILTTPVNKLRDRIGDPAFRAYQLVLNRARDEYLNLSRAGYAPFEMEVKETEKLFSDKSTTAELGSLLKEGAAITQAVWTAKENAWKRQFGDTAQFPRPFSNEALVAAQRLGVPLSPGPARIPPGARVIDVDGPGQ